jgi:hypothetical protein
MRLAGYPGKMTPCQKHRCAAAAPRSLYLRLTNEILPLALQVRGVYHERDLLYYIYAPCCKFGSNILVAKSGLGYFDTTDLAAGGGQSSTEIAPLESLEIAVHSYYVKGTAAHQRMSRLLIRKQFNS